MSTTPTPEGDLISRAAALAIFQPETSTVRKQICDDIRALPASQPQGEDKPAPAMDLAPEATEACAEQTEIVIKALRAAAREIDPKFAGHHENVGFAIRRLLNLTQSFLDACRSNDAFRQDAESLRAELDQWRAAYERASREIIECAGNHGAAEARVAELEGERDAALARVAELEAVLAQAAVPLEGLTIAANVGETNLGLGKRAWDEINNAVAHIRSALTTPGDGETRWMGERINWAGPLFYPPAGMIAVMRSGTRIEIWDDESDHLDCFTGMNLADGDASTLWGREFIDRVEPPAEDDVPRLSGHYRATSNTRHALEVDVFGILSRLARHTHDKGAE